MSSAATMSFASSYVLASRVRSKLTKQAADPKSSLRNLVLQANMLDNLMDHIATKTKTLKSENTVQFAVPEPIRHEVRSNTERNNGPSITEYEIDSDSDSDFDSDSDSDSEFESDYESDSFDSEDDEIDTAVSPVLRASLAKKNTMPVIDLSDDSQLSVIMEDDSENDLPELTHSVSSSDSDSEDYVHEPHYVYSSAKYAQSHEKLDSIDRVMSTREHPVSPHHERHNAVYSLEAMF